MPEGFPRKLQHTANQSFFVTAVDRIGHSGFSFRIAFGYIFCHKPVSFARINDYLSRAHMPRLSNIDFTLKLRITIIL
jgi:hypothetical protein